MLWKTTEKKRAKCWSNVSSRIEIIGNNVGEPDLEDGIVSFSTPNADGSDGFDGGLNQVTIEFTDPASEKRKVAERASEEDKEWAELVHKFHLLCLLARGRLIDEACDDPLLQASLISLVPAALLAIFNGNFRVQSIPFREGAIKSNMMHALDTREGTAEEVAALSVALFRALNLTARFVSILDEKEEKQKRRRNEAQAVLRWYQLLSSIITRQKLKGSIEDQPVQNQEFLNRKDESLKRQHCDHDNVETQPEDFKRNPLIFKPSAQGFSSSHEHTFPIENQSFDGTATVRRKRCPYEFSICLGRIVNTNFQERLGYKINQNFWD